MAVTVDVLRFKATRSGTVAEGSATARLSGLGGLPVTVTKKVRLSLAKRGSCKILTLVLEQFDLMLLGLNVHLDKVDLQGDRRAARRRAGLDLSRSLGERARQGLTRAGGRADERRD